jgi:hypothetical protein
MTDRAVYTPSMTRGRWRRLSPLALTIIVACSGKQHSEERNDAPHDSHAEVAEPAKRDTPITGALVIEVDGVALKEVKGWYRYGLLSLYTGDDPNNNPGQVVRFWGLPDAPNGQVVRYPGDATGVRGDRMTYENREGSAHSGSKNLEGAHYELALGKEQDYAVTVSVDAEADKPVHVRARGTITAMTLGIKMIGGEVDRSFDHLDTIEYLTRAWIEKNHVAKEFAKTPDYCAIMRAARSSAANTPAPIAACSYVYRDDKGAVGVAKLWFDKREGRWQEAGEVKPDQLLRAHPIRAAAPDSTDVLEPMAAERFEREVYVKRGGFQHVREPTFISCGGGYRPDLPGRCEIRYAVEAENRDLKETSQMGCEFATYVFERDAAGAFRISRALDTSQSYDSRSEQVVPRVLPAECQKKPK